MFDQKAYDKRRYARRAAHPNYRDEAADRVLKCRYGISLEQKREMFKDQKGLCKLCGKPLPEDFRKANVDHDHNTDEIRGLLHWNCNKLVGFFEKNTDLIGTMYTYLGWTKGEN